jgi:hypothetical protein
LKYIVRKEKGLFCNKKKIYQYFNGLKETIPKKERGKYNLIFDIMITRDKNQIMEMLSRKEQDKNENTAMGKANKKN